MLDIGWSEMLIVGLITIIVVGPKELPRVLRTVMQTVRKLRAMASEFQSGIDDLAREAELQDLKQSIEKTAATDLAGEIENAIDPTGEVGKSIKEIEGDLKKDPRVSEATAEPSVAPPHSLGDSFQQADKPKPAARAKPKKAAKPAAKPRAKAPAKSKAASKSGAAK